MAKKNHRIFDKVDLFVAHQRFDRAKSVVLTAVTLGVSIVLLFSGKAYMEELVADAPANELLIRGLAFVFCMVIVLPAIMFGMVWSRWYMYRRYNTGGATDVLENPPSIKRFVEDVYKGKPRP